MNIGIYFERNALLQSLIQKEAGGRWSSSQKCWYVTLAEKNYLQLATILNKKADLQTDELKEYLLKKKDELNLNASPSQDKKVMNPEIKNEDINQTKSAPQLNLIHQLSNENSKALSQFKQMLILKGYGESTIRTYTNEFTQFLNTLKSNSISTFSVARIKDYLQYCFETLKLSENTLHSNFTLNRYWEEKSCSGKYPGKKAFAITGFF